MNSPYLRYKGSEFYMEGVPLARLAKEVGTPFYAYSRADIEARFGDYARAFKDVPHLICFAVKACSNLAIGRVISRLGGGADIVSGGELRRVLRAGFPASKVIFSGVGKTREELALALRSRVRLINVESAEELSILNGLAKELGIQAAISLRVNPDVRAGSHPHIRTGTPENKFGVYYKDIFPLYMWAKTQRYLNPVGIQCHIGSQILRVGPYVRALQVLLGIVKDLWRKGIFIEVLDLGGGLGVKYDHSDPDSPRQLAEAILPYVRGTGLTLFLEPGRSLVAQSGVLVTRVLYRKEAGPKHFVIVDAAMNDLARPALYDAFHEIVPVRKISGKKVPVDVVGPVCESGDYLARGRLMRLPERDSLLAVLTAGAYGFSMSSQYNSRPRIPEVLVSGNRFHIIRRREKVDDLMRGETIPKELK